MIAVSGRQKEKQQAAQCLAGRIRTTTVAGYEGMSFHSFGRIFARVSGSVRRLQHGLQTLSESDAF